MNRCICLPRRLIFWHGCLALLAVSGCASQGDVTGTVTYQGKNVASGSVIIRGSDLLPYSGAIEEDGTYVVRNVPTGLAKITVVSLPPDAGRHAELLRRSPKKEAEEAAAPVRARADPNKWM